MNKPGWFVRNCEMEPQIIGAKRPGEWSLLMSTCINGSYRGNALAIPVLNEVMTDYAIDGIFYNSPRFIPCWCEVCRKKYKKLYKKELPLNSEDFENTWESICVHDNIKNLYSFIKGKNEEVPVILYYYSYNQSITERKDISDMFCTESQDVLSLGRKSIPEVWKPSLSMKVGRSIGENKPCPFGIIHSSPGMDWRHTGLPTAEYIFWLSQIPANGGHIWHSLTGIPDTIVDKRILKTISRFNDMLKKVESCMEGAKIKAPVALLWNGLPSGEGWASGLLNKQVQFTVLMKEQAVLEKMKKFKAVIVPEEWSYTVQFASDLAEYVKQGGNVVVEGKIPLEYEELYKLLGITDEISFSEQLTASYLRFEGSGNPLQKGMEETELIAHRGQVLYCTPTEGTKVLATLVPPFSPLESVGAPPERGSLPVSHTDIPLCILNQYYKGKALFVPFSLSKLINECRLEEHYLLMANAVNSLTEEYGFIKVTPYQGLQVTVFEKGKSTIINLVNGSGSRPLQQNIKLHDLELEIKLDKSAAVKSVKQLIAGEKLTFLNENGTIKIMIPELDVWECLLVEAI